MNSRILVVDDDAALAEMIGIVLGAEGFAVDTCPDGSLALDAFHRSTPDLVLLDLMLPGLDGFELFKRLSSQNGFDVPVIFLTARTTEVDKVSGLNLGADDYITKPFGVLELIARVNAVIRRRGRSARPQQAIESGGLKMDVSAHTLYVDGEKTELTYKEFEILRYFMRNPGLVLTREMLLNEIWGIDTDIETRTVDMHIKTLRQKIGRRGEHIKTVRGVGYRFEV